MEEPQDTDERGIEAIRRELEKAEDAGFTEQSAEEILVEIKRNLRR